MRVDLLRGDVRVAEHALDAHNVRSALQEMRGKGVADGVREARLVMPAFWV
jgi:hypothetical protein